jgi:hypothetical protein
MRTDDISLWVSETSHTHSANAEEQDHYVLTEDLRHLPPLDAHPSNPISNTSPLGVDGRHQVCVHVMPDRPHEILADRGRSAIRGECATSNASAVTDMALPRHHQQ